MAKKRNKSDKPKSGGARLVASGKKPVLLGLTPEQYKEFSDCANLDNRPLTQFLINSAHKECLKIRKKFPKIS